MNNYFIITGAPGTGKSTLLRELHSLGHACVDEPARYVLSEQRAKNGAGLPAKDPLLFIQMMLKKSLESYKNSKSITGPVFFDRGIPDMIAYAVHFGVDTSTFEKTAREYDYNQRVFVLPPWRAIFVNDNERTLSYERTLEFHDQISFAYKSLNVKLVEVPLADVQSRVKYILTRI